MSDAAERRASRELARNLKPWREYIEDLKAFGAREDLAVEVRNPGHPHYQIACLTGNGVRLVVYPHRSSAGNEHARVRNENSSDKAAAIVAMGKLGLWVNNKGILR